MSFLMGCGLCCMCLSIWAMIQLSLMGYFYYIETPILIEDVEEHHPDDFQDFIVKTRANYEQNAYNCWATAGAYGVTFLMSLLCIAISKRKAKMHAKKLENDELACVTIMPKEPLLVAAPPVKRRKSPKSPKHRPKKAKGEKAKQKPNPSKSPRYK